MKIKNDWSGIRDSGDVAIGKMMRVAVKELLKPTKTKPKKKVEKKIEKNVDENKNREWAERWRGRVLARGS